MFKDLISVDIGNRYIKIMVGNNKKIFKCATIDTPENAVNNDKISDVNAISEVIDNFLREYNILARDVCFMIHGSDVIIRHLEIPIMSVSKIAENVKFEITQYLPDIGENHYIDYQIMNKINTKQKKVYEVMVVATPKYKVDVLVQISKKLRLNLKGVDISANSVGRVFKNVYLKHRKLKSIGVIDIGSTSSRIIILDQGELFFEREVNFGIENIINEISSFFNKDIKGAKDFFISHFDLNDETNQNDMQVKIREMMNDAINNFEKVIKFYNTGKTNKKLDCIYLIGAGTQIYGIERYVQERMNTEARIIKSASEFNTHYSFPSNLDFRFYVNSFGMYLRDSKTINILPPDAKKTKESIYYSRRIGVAAIIAAAVLVVGILGPFACSMAFQKEKENLEDELIAKKKVVTENKKLEAQNKEYKNCESTLDKLKKKKQTITTKITGLGDYIPSDVSLTAINYSDKGYTITGTTKNPALIYSVAGNLEMSSDYYHAQIMNQTFDKGIYTFNISLER